MYDIRLFVLFVANVDVRHLVLLVMSMAFRRQNKRKQDDNLRTNSYGMTAFEAYVGRKPITERTKIRDSADTL